MRLTGATLILSSFAVFSAYGQSVISVHSGVVHYVDGSAFLQDKAVEMKFGHFPEIKVNETFRTEEGRAEILLTPGSFLRVAENSEVRMLSNQLSDTRLELIKGEILVESVDFTKDSAAAKVKGNVISVLFNGTTTILEKAGLYGFTSDPSRLRVYEGEALVKTASDQLTLKKGKETQLGGTLMAEKFDAKAGDELTRWSSRRAGYLATANVSAARSMYNDSNNWSSYGNGYMGGSMAGSMVGSMGGWFFNPMFGMYTFVPMGGMAFSPFGYSYFSPYAAGYYYPYYGGSYYPGSGYYNSGSGSGGSGSSANGAAPSRRSTGNYGGNSAIRGTVANHSRGPVGSTGSGSTYSGSRSSASTVSDLSTPSSTAVRGGGGGGMSSMGGGASSGGGRGGASSGSSSARGR